MDKEQRQKIRQLWSIVSAADKDEDMILVPRAHAIGFIDAVDQLEEESLARRTRIENDELRMAELEDQLKRERAISDIAMGKQPKL